MSVRLTGRCFSGDRKGRLCGTDRTDDRRPVSLPRKNATDEIHRADVQQPATGRTAERMDVAPTIGQGSQHMFQGRHTLTMLDKSFEHGDHRVDVKWFR